MSRHLFFIGIAGHAMRGLALACRDRGDEVSGLDEGAVTPGSDWLDQHELTWTREVDPKLLEGVDLIIISGGTAADHPLLALAEERGIEVQSFAEFLGEFTADKRVISVGGTHGKTTTTALITWLLESGGYHPDYLIGIQPFNFPASARLEGSEVAVIEGDEYKASNLDIRAKLEYYHPDALMLTSVEHDHPDVYADLDAVIRTFRQVLAAMPSNGRVVAWAESETVATVTDGAPCEVVTYGHDLGEYQAHNVAYLPAGIEFDILGPLGPVGRLAVPLFGRHNVLNALAATVVALGEGLEFDEILAGATTFKGAYRRFNVLSDSASAITIIDDYAHHPTEVATTIEAAKLHFGGRRLVVVFRPHTYSRTKALLDDYHHAFGGANVAYITDIEGARERGQVTDISGDDLARGVKGAVYEPDRAQLFDRIVADAKPGDVILCMTVSGYDKLADELATRLA